MAYILKSNTIVEDPTGRFPLYTRFGITQDRDMARFVIAMENAGYGMPEAEYRALGNFVGNLKENGVWGKIVELYPLMGNSMIAASIKLKSFTETLFMTPLGGIDDSTFEFSGGRILGKGLTPVVTFGAPRFGTGLKVEDLGVGAGFHFLGGGSASVTPAVEYMMGTMQDEGVTGIGTYVGMRLDQSGTRIAYSSTARAATQFRNLNGFYGYEFEPNPSNLGVSTRIAQYWNGVLDGRDTYTPIQYVGRDAEIALLGRNHYSGEEIPASTAGYSGRIRLAAITNGFMTEGDVAALYDEVGILAAALGKSFN